MLIIEKTITESTNTDAIELARDGAENFTVVWAHMQTAGRGRQGRKWTSINGNVLWSMIIRPQPEWPNFTDLVFINALAVRDAIIGEIGGATDVLLKWPNDIIISNNKVAGSLIETGGIGVNRHPDWVVIGTGINVVDHPTAPDMIYPPTSLHRLGFSSATRDSLIQRLNAAVSRRVTAWSQFGFAASRNEYLKNAFRLGQEITVGQIQDKSTYETGVYEGISSSGELILRLPDQRLKQFNSHDVIARR